MPIGFCSRLSARVHSLIRQPWLLSLAIFTVVAAIGGYFAFPVASQTQPRISAAALNQIQALIREKSSRTPAQRKLDSQLLDTVKMRRGEPIAPGVPTLQNNVKVEPNGKTLVDLSAVVTDGLRQQIENAGGEIQNSFPQYNTLRALVPVTSLESLANLDIVNYISRAAEGRTHRDVRQASACRGVSDAPSGNDKRQAEACRTSRAERVKAQLPSIISSIATTNKRRTLLTGSVTSQGDKTHGADLARATYGVDGTGIKIGVLSDSVDHLAESQASGDLGPVTVLPGQSGAFLCFGPCSGEGTAMLEIIHDLAPGAQLYFATAFISPAGFAQNILDLREAGCDIIVDDVEYFNESPFQDGIIAQAVNSVTADGVLYFSSAGNDGNLSDGTSGVWEGNFVSGGPITVDGDTATAHSFGATNFNPVAAAFGNSSGIQLFWSDPLGGSANDYDVYVVSPDGAFVYRRSDNFQTGTQDPYELVGPLYENESILIVLYQGSPRFLHLGVINGRLGIATSGRIKGHTAASNAFSVAATPAAAAFPGPPVGPTGPFPNLFNSTNTVELFSSDGPRRIFYNADGTPITPDNFLATGGAVRQKPDIAAADGVATTFAATTGLNPFFGTSAAAPHAAAIAALLKSYRPALTPTQVRSIFNSTAIDIEAPGVDRDSGAGIVMAQAALQSVSTGVILSASPISRTVVQGQSANYTINLNRISFAGAVTLSAAGLPAGATAAFAPNGTTGNSSALTINTAANTPAGTYTVVINATATGTTIFPITITLVVNSNCVYAISPGNQSFTIAGGTGTVNVTTTAGCPWTAVSQASWITITSAASGSGNGVVNFSVSANTGYGRALMIKIAGQSFNVNQAGGIPGQWSATGNLTINRRYFTLVALSNGKVLAAGGSSATNGGALATAELYDPATGVWSSTGSMLTPRVFHTATLLPSGKVLVAGGSSAESGGGVTTYATAELYDPISGTWSVTGSMSAPYNFLRSILLANGKALVIATGDASSNRAEVYDPISGTWSVTGAPQFTHYGPTITLLQSGKVLLVAGDGNTRPTSACELYDPTSGIWSLTGYLSQRRYLHQTVLLQNGKVLVIGGEDYTCCFYRILDSVELYDPATETWSQVSSMRDGREFHAAVTLASGKVLVAGGGYSNFLSSELFDPTTGRWSEAGGMVYGPGQIVRLSNGKALAVSSISSGSFVATAELYDPNEAGKWSNTGSLNTPRWAHTATLLQNGKILVIGGNGSDAVLRSAETFDWSTAKWSNTGQLNTARRNHTATLLGNGKVLVTGGFTSAAALPSGNSRSSPLVNSAATASVELYDPATGVWTLTGNMSAPRGLHTATLLPNGKVLVTGGNNGSTLLSSAELYDPGTGAWTPTSNMARVRTAHVAALLLNGKVFVGFGYGGSPDAQLYDPSNGSWSATAPLFESYEYAHGAAARLPNGQVVIAGGTTVGIYPPRSSFVYDPSANNWLAPYLGTTLLKNTATLLPATASVLVAGGDDLSGTLNNSALYQPATGYRPTSSLNTPRELHTATALPNGKVLVAGGANDSQSLGSAEIYDPCTFSISSTGQSFTAGSGAGSFNITTSTGCAWTAASNESWITITSGGSGNGAGAVNFSVGANSGPARSGVIIAAGLTFTVTQSSGCIFTISPTIQSFAATGSAGAVAVSTTAVCSWTATSNEPWISITSGASGNGNGSVAFSVFANSGPGRIGTITIAGRTFTVIQAGVNCGAVLFPASANFNFVGGAGSVGVTISAGCAWTATSNDAWITITSGASGNGNGVVNFSAATNQSPSPRTGAMTIAGQTFTVTQAANLGGLQYYPLPRPIRLLDTRQGATGCFTPGTPLQTGSTRTQLARTTCDNITIPANAQAVVGNATVVNFQSAGGFITLYPTGAQQPTVSNLNYSANQIIPNAFTVGLGTNGEFDIFASGATNFIVDITGYYAPPGSGGLYYHPLPSPIRLLDTRLGETACNAPGTPLQAAASRIQNARLTCNGITIPANAQAIVGNGTVVNSQSGGGFITLYPSGAQQPTVSNLNYTANQIIPNAFTVGLGANGEFNIFASAATNFIVDITGYFSPDAAPDVNGVTGLFYNPLAKPIRLLDSRPGATGCTTPGTPLAGGQSLMQQARVTCDGVTIPAGAQAVVGNATVVNFISGGGFITLYPSDAQQPTVSNLNYLANQIIPNAFTVSLGSDGAFKIFPTTTTHFIVDLTGYFAP